jgi:hypothetical protein
MLASQVGLLHRVLYLFDYVLLRFYKGLYILKRNGPIVHMVGEVRLPYLAGASKMFLDVLNGFSQQVWTDCILNR